MLYEELPTTLKVVCTPLVIALALAASAPAEPYDLHSFDSQELTDIYYSEGANVGDINGDGHVDIVHGPYWFEGPRFDKKHEIYPAQAQQRQRYADSFFSWVYDFDGDGHNDVLFVGFSNTPAFVYQNPGPDGLDRPWNKREVLDSVTNEAPQFTDVVGDERPELVCTNAGRFGYATINEDEPLEPWTFHAVSEPVAPRQFGHGLGIGDVDGDGRNDIICKSGWYQQPESLEGDPLWQFHPVEFAKSGGAEMYAYDVDGDGDNDVITSLEAHAYGLAWSEQYQENGERKFRQRLIMGKRPNESRYGLVFTEPHSVALADIDGDGLKDIVTGKTYWSHHTKSPMWDAGAVVYWFRLVRGPNGVDWVPYLADGEAGVGRQITVADVNGDKLPDIVVGGMKGAHVLLHNRQTVDQKTWQEQQPKPYNAESASVPAGRDSQKQPGDDKGSAGEKSSDNTKAAGNKLAKSERQKNKDGEPSAERGVLPTDDTGRPLNLDFETGTLQDWTAEGSAFVDQPVQGDTIAARRDGMHSNHQGKYWVGTFENQGDMPTGTLTSVPFKVPYRWVSFLFNGGSGQNTRVEILTNDTHRMIYRYFGQDREDMRPIVADLKNYVGEEIRIRLVDNDSGSWGHVNFDNFRFHKNRPGPVTPFDEGLVPDEYPYAGLSAEKAAQAMKLPEGFSVLVGAAEPDVKQPIAMALDDRGRVWIAEAYEYPVRAEGDKGRDRILVFEDTDGDGTLDSRKVFAEGLNLVSGLEVGFGGVWVGAAPYLMFIPDRDGDDVPDGEPEILLDGWHYEDTHETLNTFIWGPDGWLYGCHGVFTHSLVGKPGTPDKDRVPLNAAIWRYHPTRHQFEVFANGTSNPWGVDFNDRGQAFCTACVIPHLFHIIQDARYLRQGGPHFNPYTYDDIKTIADHRHYLGAKPHTGNGKSDAVGGGHAHAGAMIYLGGAWPEQYHDQIFMNNIHGQRLNVDCLTPRGSGYVGSHTPDFLLTGDQSSQILNLRYGPDGQAYMIDWYDMQACHDRDPSVHDRSNGRIYKIVYGKPKSAKIDLKEKSDDELAELVLNENDWYVRHARRILQERAAAGSIASSAVERLAEIATTNDDPTRQLRAMWALHVTENFDDHLGERLLADDDPYVRGWTIQLLLDRDEKPSDQLVARFATMAGEDSSQIVRLYLASAAGRLPLDQRWDILAGLTSHPEDAGDHNLPLMYWYAAEPLAEDNPERALALALSAGRSIPLISEFMLRRIGSSDTASSLDLLVSGLGKADDAPEQLTFLKGIRGALRGQRRVQPPAQWHDIYQQLAKSNDPQVREQATALALTFGDKSAMRSFHQIVASSSGDQDARRAALAALLAAGDPQLPGVLQQLVLSGDLRDAALRGLAHYDDPKTPKVILSTYDALSPSERRAAVATLCSRAAYAKPLLAAMEEGKVNGTDLTADLVRQLRNLKDDQVDATLARVWGTVRETPADKAKLIAQYKEMVEKQPSDRQPDPSHGRAVFAKTCLRCHTLFGTGAKIGPDLTGSNRADLDYLLSNVVDPSAVMAKEYQPSVIQASGRVITGIVTAETPKSLTIVTADETVLVPMDEIDERQLSGVSMMPDDQLKQFSEEEVLSLIDYLQSPYQVPMLATADNAVTLFNGTDLAGWSGDPSLWSVSDGQIVGRTSGIKHNAFLVSDLAAEDFRLSVEVKLADDKGNSGVQFRSATNGNEMEGYQADIGTGWWGKLYEENGRGLLWKESGEQHLKKGEWNKYEILAQGSHIRTYLNGQLCVDLDDPDGAARGVFALQLHSGGPTDVRFRNFKLEVLDDAPPPTESTAAGQ